MKDTIVYFGIIQYEYGNAMCQHAEGVKMLIEAAGFKPVMIGVSKNVKKGNIKRINAYTYVINEPSNVFERMYESISSKDIVNILKDIGIKNIKAFIMGDFRYWPMKKMIGFCDKNNINFVVNIMDRFVSNGSIISKIKMLDSALRMKYLYPKIERRMYICHAYNKLIGEGNHTAVIPGVSYKSSLPEGKNEEDKICLVFLGRPGLKCEKEKIDWVIRAIYKKKLTDKIKVYLAGFDKQEFLDNNPEIKKFLTDHIEFLGRINHDECLKLLKFADFSLVIRPDTTLSEYGFSTKIGESFSYGIPVLATNTSDNSLYIENGKNGYICGCSYEEVEVMLEFISKLTFEKRDQLKKNLIKNNPLYYKDYVGRFKKVVC